MLLNISNKDKQEYFSQKKKGGIVYKITNILNNNFYIGSSTNLNKRYYTHLNDMRTEKKTCIKLNRAVKKYNESNFKFEILAKCPIEYVIKLEQWFISNLNPHYNIAKIAGSNLGVKRSKKVKNERSKIQKLNWSKEDYRTHHIEKLSLNWKKGSLHKLAKVNEETVKQIKILLNSKTCLEVSNQLNISIHIIKDIKRNKTWRHVTI